MATYLSVEFNSKHESLKSPIAISVDLIDYIRQKYPPLKCYSYAEFDPDLFSKKNLYNTFQYILENVDHSKTKLASILCSCAERVKFFSKLPPSENFIFVDPKEPLKPFLTWDGESLPLVKDKTDKNENHLVYSFDEFAFEIDQVYNEIVKCPSLVDTMTIIQRRDFDKNHYLYDRVLKGLKTRENAVSDINKLQLRENWRKDAE